MTQILCWFFGVCAAIGLSAVVIGGALAWPTVLLAVVVVFWIYVCAIVARRAP